MKQFLVCLLGISLMSSVAMAQQFSNSLGGGSSQKANSRYGVNRTQSNSTSSYNDLKATSKKGVVKTVLRFTPAQIRLDDEHEKQIMPIIRRVQEGRTKSVEVVAISKNYNSTYQRINTLRQLFIGYTPNLIPSFRHITGRAVFNSNDNTVEIYEYY